MGTICHDIIRYEVNKLCIQLTSRSVSKLIISTLFLDTFEPQSQTMLSVFIVCVMYRKYLITISNLATKIMYNIMYSYFLYQLLCTLSVIFYKTLYFIYFNNIV